MQKLTRNKFAYSGWLAAALVIGVFAGTGFQDSMKLGVVDINRVIVESGLQREAQARVQAAFAVRQAILEYMRVERILTREQCLRFRDLELKDDKTDQEKTELLAIKVAVTAAIEDLRRIQEKLAELTEDERKRLGDYTDSKNTTERLMNEWVRDFEADLTTLAQETDREMIAKAQAAVQEVAKRGGYTLVFSMTAAVYAANDITDEVIKEAEK